MSDEQIKEEWSKVENIDHILEMIKRCDYDIFEYLADTVASLCDVKVEDMFSKSNAVYLAQPRWLFWYAYRYMTNETYEKTASRSRELYGHKYTPNTIGQCINKMAVLIDEEPIWKKRWVILKKIIKLRNTGDNEINNTIVINIPKEIKEHVKIEIKEK